MQGRVQRQRAQVDAGDAGSRDRAGRVSGLSALHHPRAVGCEPGLASPASGHSGTARHPDPRRDQLSQTGPALGRRGAPVLWRLGKIANCQVATTVALWTGVRAWFLGAMLYLPETWLTADQRQRARIPAGGGVSGEVAPSAHLAPAGACGRIHTDSRRRRRGIWGCHRVARHTASTPAAVCAGDLVESGRLHPTPSAAQRRTLRRALVVPARAPRLIDGSRAVAVSDRGPQPAGGGVAIASRGATGCNRVVAPGLRRSA